MYGKKFCGNCDTKICMGCGDILTASYISEYLGVATVETNAIRKEAGFDGKFTYGMENIATNKRNLMNPDELLKLDHKNEIVMVRGRKPFVCNKYMYIKHPKYELLEDMTVEEQRQIFKENMQLENKKVETKKAKYSFKDF